MPRNGKQDASIGGLGNHQRGIAGQEAARQNKMRSLADGEQRFVRLAVHVDNLFDVHAGSIHHRLGLQFEICAAFLVVRANADDFAVALDEACGCNVVNGHATEILERAQQRDRIAGIVELAVVIENAAAQAFAFDARKFFQCRLAREHFGMPEGQFPREPFIDFETDPVVRKRKIAVSGDDEVEVVHQVRRIAQHEAALAQSIQNQRHVHLLEIAHAAVHQLGAAAGGFFREVGALHQQGAIPSRRSFNGGAEAGSPAANHQYIPGRRIAAKFFQNFIAFAHACTFLSWLPEYGKQPDPRRGMEPCADTPLDMADTLPQINLDC